MYILLFLMKRRHNSGKNSHNSYCSSPCLPTRKEKKENKKWPPFFHSFDYSLWEPLLCLTVKSIIFHLRNLICSHFLLNYPISWFSTLMKYDSLARWRLVSKKPIITELIDFSMMMFIEMKKWYEESWFEMTSWECYCYFLSTLTYLLYKIFWMAFCMAFLVWENPSEIFKRTLTLFISKW